MAELKEKQSRPAAKKRKSFYSSTRGKMIFAFDFGEFAVKVGVLKIRKNGAEVRHLFTVENPENLTKPDAGNIRAWKARIQRGLSKRNLMTDNQLAICTVGGKYYIHRQLEIPSVADADLDGLAESEMSQMLSLDSSNYVFQSERTDVLENGEEKKDRVWTVAIPKETCEAIHELIRSLKLRPFVMDIHANGIRRLLRADPTLSRETEGKTVVCIDYGMTHTELFFIKDGKLMADTLLDSGDARLVSEAKNVLSLRIADPGNYNKLTASPEEIYGIMNRSATNADARSFTVTVEDWLNSIQTAISRYNFEHPEGPVERVYMYGGSPQLVWLVQYLANLTRLPASVISDSTLFDTEAVFGSRRYSIAGYLSLLSLSLMD